MNNKKFEENNCTYNKIENNKILGHKFNQEDVRHVHSTLKNIAKRN